jgi:hypothetical protein
VRKLRLIEKSVAPGHPASKSEARFKSECLQVYKLNHVLSLGCQQSTLLAHLSVHSFGHSLIHPFIHSFILPDCSRGWAGEGWNAEAMQGPAKFQGIPERCKMLGRRPLPAGGCAQEAESQGTWKGLKKIIVTSQIGARTAP